MLSCKSPRKVMLLAHHLGTQALPRYACKCSRHDFTLPQLFACLVVKEQQKRSYREAEALLRDADHWCRAIGMRKAPDHNTLCRAAKALLGKWRVDKVLDAMVRLAALVRALGLSTKPLAGDATCFEERHVSRYYEHRRGRGTGDRGRRAKLARVPKLAMTVASACHLIVSLRAVTGAGGDQPHLGPLLRDARRRLPHRRFTAVLDAGFDGESRHEQARSLPGVRAVIPPALGAGRRAPGRPPHGRWRRVSWRLLRTKASRRRCGYTQRWQSETAGSMMKRNLGSFCRGKTPASRLRDLRLKALTHNVMVL